MKKNSDILIILGSICVSWMIAMSANLAQLELGALINLIYPLLLGIGLLCLYTILKLFKVDEKWTRSALVVVVIMNLVIGLVIRFVDF